MSNYFCYDRVRVSSRKSNASVIGGKEHERRRFVSLARRCQSDHAQVGKHSYLLASTPSLTPKYKFTTLLCLRGPFGIRLVQSPFSISIPQTITRNNGLSPLLAFSTFSLHIASLPFTMNYDMEDTQNSAPGTLPSAQVCAPPWPPYSFSADILEKKT